MLAVEGPPVAGVTPKAPCHTSPRHRRVVDIDGEVGVGGYLPWKEEQLNLVQVEHRVMCPHPVRDIGETSRGSGCGLAMKRTVLVV